MYTYIVMLLISLFFAGVLTWVKKQQGEYLCIKSFKIKKKYGEYCLLILSMLPFILISGFRRGIGYDYNIEYVPTFDAIAQGADFANAGTEWGYYWINKLVIMLGGGYVWVFLVTSIITIGFFWCGFYQQSKNLCMSIVMFFCGEMFFLSMDGVRQFMGLAIAFYGFKYIKKRSFLKYAAFILLGCLFHRSTIILLPLYVLSCIKINPLVMSALIGFGCAINGSLKAIITYIVSYTPYAGYINSILFNGFDRILMARVFVYALMFLVAGAFYFVKGNKDSHSYVFFFNTLSIGMFISLNANIIPAPNRICWTLEIVLLLLVPMILESCDKKVVKYALGIAIVAAFSMSTYHEIIVLENQGAVPYVFTFMPYLVFK
ncbi:MAG: EpsG family protein [Oscillospiraceae bacterium]